MGLIQKTLERLSKDKELLNKVCSLYNEYNGRKKVAELLNVPYNSLGHIAKELGIQTDRHARRSILKYYGTIRNPFDGSDFGDYLIGYIIGDGSIIYKNGKLQGVNVSSSDKEHLEKIRDKWDKNLRITGPIKGNYVINCYDKAIAEHLCTLGFVPAKSKVGMVLNYPVSWPLVRGLFDSDGCVTYRSGRKRLAMFIYGTDSYIQDIRNFIGIESHIVERKTFVGIAWYRQELIKEIYKLMYNGASICLERKYERFYGNFEHKEH